MKTLFFIFVSHFYINYGRGQMLQFGSCPEVETMPFFDLERFLGKWYALERYPIWYEGSGQCAYKTIEACGRNIQIEHAFVREGIQYVLKMNSTYTPGDQAVFPIGQDGIDPIGIPITVLTTNYSDYALIYGCRLNTMIGIKYTVAWILSREQTLPEETIATLRTTLNSIPFTSSEFLERVYHDERNCNYHWTANVQPAYGNVN